jgi:hypothetical protein
MACAFVSAPFFSSRLNRSISTATARCSLSAAAVIAAESSFLQCRSSASSLSIALVGRELFSVIRRVAGRGIEAQFEVGLVAVVLVEDVAVCSMAGSGITGPAKAEELLEFVGSAGREPERLPAAWAHAARFSGRHTMSLTGGRAADCFSDTRTCSCDSYSFGAWKKCTRTLARSAC